MAQLFEEVAEPNHPWEVIPLEGEFFPLGEGRRNCAAVSRKQASDTGIVLARRRDPSRNVETWVMLAPAGHRVRINGSSATLGIRALHHKDCVEFGGRRMFFSAERLARAEPFAAPGDKPVFCPRCKQPIAPGTPSVRCPACGVAYHQTADLPCWTYSRTCAFCPQPTELRDALTWTPEEL